ncbi:MAG: OsmC family peroxiredoxin [Gammaproteobacteria bacterium]|jgi:organic hydroperoxide reductase OsmC/OhrA|nr:OsmC family peroxiredoxin [Gammaproteobacteria bacterium]
MQDLPHLYTVSATAKPDVNVKLAAAGLPDLETAGPPEFGGPGDVWSPETLLVGAVADCFILSFRAIARTARLEWTELECTADGTLDKLGKFNQFTGFTVKAKLTVPEGTNKAKAETILEKAEKYCLITNSMKADSHLIAEVVSR